MPACAVGDVPEGWRLVAQRKLAAYTPEAEQLMPRGRKLAVSDFDC